MSLFYFSFHEGFGHSSRLQMTFHQNFEGVPSSGFQCCSWEVLCHSGSWLLFCDLFSFDSFWDFIFIPGILKYYDDVHWWGSFFICWVEFSVDLLYLKTHLPFISSLIISSLPFSPFGISWVLDSTDFLSSPPTLYSSVSFCSYLWWRFSAPPSNSSLNYLFFLS